MFRFNPQLSHGCALALICCLLNLLMMHQPTNAELSPVVQGEFFLPILPDDHPPNTDTSFGGPISNLYDNLLQREYAGPVVFPNHQVERKAQRSPSLRLRFGRSDPDMLNNIVEKRWFGDVNQKPIRSPSLRLRFGRRDPTLPQMRRTAYDDLLERELTLNNQQQQQLGDTADDLSADYDGLYERVVRKPQRLRWGRSVPQFEATIGDNDQLYNSLWNSEKMRRMLLALQQYEAAPGHVAGYANDGDDTEAQLDEDTSEFQREARKPMRLRWGRSTGKAPQIETSSIAPKN
uniref:Short neuropeptide F n=1 Tax=Drosophila pseudoobscura pseudoobscura TaxID=46245 RepID=SNPF_DROPS|nr:RecName: Full=Short neuropeptide F; Contains: RecName: Full=sNPF-associated peptide; Contains: RecName: Full=sNPF peptide 2; Contains: RecName: Full=RLRF peptide 1; Contains: RecName: Full=RLRF peptide 2; Flags: Precursor [Drosophila pseudoobscura pseudoobscura]